MWRDGERDGRIMASQLSLKRTFITDDKFVKEVLWKGEI